MEELRREVKQWLATTAPALATALHGSDISANARSGQHLRANGFRTYIVTGSGQDFVRTYSDIYGTPPEQVIGTAGGTTYGYPHGRPAFHARDAKLLLNDDDAASPRAFT